MTNHTFTVPLNAVERPKSLSHIIYVIAAKSSCFLTSLSFLSLEVKTKRQLVILLRNPKVQNPLS